MTIGVGAGVGMTVGVGPAMVMNDLLESNLPLAVQTALLVSQFVVGGSVMIRSSSSEGVTVISQRMLGYWPCGSVRRTAVVWPSVTVSTWSITFLKLRAGSSLKWISNVKAADPS